MYLKKVRIVSILVILCMISGLMVGCGEKKAEEADGPRVITDMAGRTVELPDTIDKAFTVSPVAGIYLYTFDPDKMLGWNYELNDLEKEIILPEYSSLPAFGMADAINYEAVIEAGPQIALNVASDDEASIAEADKLSESLGIPVIILSDKMEKTDEVYSFLGEIFQNEERGKELSEYVAKVFSDVESAEIPDADKVTMYYGNGENSLETAPSGTTHSEIMDFVNAKNVADMEIGDGSRVQISAEQLLAWNPQYIIVNGEPKKDITGKAAAEEILTTPEFATVKAVEDGNVLGTPNTPFSWIDRPPGPNRIIGIVWLSNVLYPEVYECDIIKEVKDFYKLFYHVDLTDDQIKNTIGL